jgi:hypothetical protein
MNEKVNKKIVKQIILWILISLNTNYINIKFLAYNEKEKKT